MKEKKAIVKEIELPEGVSASYSNIELAVKGQKGELKRVFLSKKVDIKVDGNKITLTGKGTTKREKKMVGTFASHIRNMVKGAIEGHIYKLKICSGHFPMNVALNGKDLVIKNFFGEKHPRTLRIKDNVQLKVEGDLITVESISKELAGQCAADIESLTRRPNFDTRIFQDGIYIIEKDGKAIK